MAEDYEPAVTAEAEGEHEEEMTWNDLTVPQLKEELSVRGLETTGKKAELVARLEKYDNGAVFILVVHSIHLLCVDCSVMHRYC